MNQLFQLEALESRRLLSSSILADYNGIYPTESITLNGVSYFAANDGAHGSELWRCDGNPGGTQMVKDLVPGKGGSSPYLIGVLDGKLIFFAGSPMNGSEVRTSLYISDGTADGTILIHSFSTGVLPDYFKIINDRLIGAVVNSPQGASNSDPLSLNVDIWVSDGTAGGTMVVQHFENTDGQSCGFLSSASVVGDHAVFRLTGGKAYASDGTASGTFELNTGSPHFISTMASAQGKAYYLCLEGASEAPSDTGTWALWQTDGTLAGTSRVATLDVGNQQICGNITVAGDHLFFPLAINGGMSSSDYYLWTSDGTAGGTQQVCHIPSFFDYLNSVGLPNGELVLFQNMGDPSPNFALIVSDGTPTSTPQIVARFATGEYSPIAIGNTCFFLVNPQTEGAQWELWRSDGTAAGTLKIQNVGVFHFDTISLYSLGVADGKLIVNTPDETFTLDPYTMKPPIGALQNQMTLENGQLRIFGTRSADTIRLYDVSDNLDRFIVNLNGVKKSFAFADISTITIYSYSGDDAITVRETLAPFTARCRVFAGSGNDTILTGSGRDTSYGGDGDDWVLGANGSDYLCAGAGNDFVGGGAGNDKVYGNAGADTLCGNKGNDFLVSGNDQAQDVLSGGAGANVLFGQSVYDTFFSTAGIIGSDSDEILQV